MSRFAIALAMAIAASGSAAPLSAQSAAPGRPFTVEYYYKIKWGYTAEWMDLYKKNHYPVLLKQQELGRIVSMSAVVPAYHAGEESRWDLRFTITWKNAEVAHDGFDSSTIVRALYPDQERFRKEEQRRFELLLEHLDVPVYSQDLTTWRK
jgi:hypothetical protein